MDTEFNRMSNTRELEADRLARVKLSCATEPGDLRVTGLVSEAGAGKILGYLEAAAEVESHWAFAIGHELAHVDASRVLEQAESRGIRFLTPADAEWPDQLGALRDAGALHERGGEPVGLWVRGEGDLRHAVAAVAVVGSRAATSYGMEQASDLSRELTSMGQTIVSGLAFGVDQAAHRGALAAGGPTIAVMPCGVDRPYPTAHAQLLEAIAQRGLVVSETPPGTAPTRTRFLARNRIVAGLAEGTVLVEGAVRSGALNTARWTSNLHRPVMGVPGPVSSAASVGVHQLIRLGEATMVTNAQEVLTDLTTPVAAARPAQVDESYLPGPVRHAPAPLGAAAATRSAPSR
jgi:DNA processing protein